MTILQTPLSTEVTNEWSYTSIPPTCLSRLHRHIYLYIKIQFFTDPLKTKIPPPIQRQHHVWASEILHSVG